MGVVVQQSKNHAELDPNRQSTGGNTSPPLSPRVWTLFGHSFGRTPEAQVPQNREDSSPAQPRMVCGMDTVERSRRAAAAAARDAATRARSLAEGLEALARSLDMLVVESHQPEPTSGRERAARSQDTGLWSATEVARYLKTSKSWVYGSSASGLLPYRKIGGLLRFDPNEIRSWSAARSRPK